MIIEDISKREFLKMLDSIETGFIYNYKGKMIKFDKTFAGQMMTKKKINPSSSTDIKVDQIFWLSSLNSRIKNSSLPEGIVSYEHIPVGIIYPHYFKDYKSLLELSNEDYKLLLSNLRRAIKNDIELTDNGIYNTDFALKNALYRGSDVQLIDLDGKHIKRRENSNYAQAYSYFTPDMFMVIARKLVKIYGKENAEERIKELKNIFMYYRQMDRETPLMILDEVEKSRILK